VSAYRLADRVVTALNKHFAHSHEWFEAHFARNASIATQRTY
jgi:hypothetical protein